MLFPNSREDRNTSPRVRTMTTDPMALASINSSARTSSKMAMETVDTPIDYLNTHGTSTPVGDVKELEAIRKVFPEKTPFISATKAMTGHALGAAGVHEAIYSLLMMKNGFVTPSINIDNLDEASEGMKIVREPTEAKLSTVMSNSFGFGGTNASLVLREYQD